MKLYVKSLVSLPSDLNVYLSDFASAMKSLGTSETGLTQAESWVRRLEDAAAYNKHKNLAKYAQSQA